MEGWISGRELLERWKIKAFELIDIIRKGLQPYDHVDGRKIVDECTLPKKKLHPTYEACLAAVKAEDARHSQIAANQLPGSGTRSSHSHRPMTEEQTKEKAKALFQDQSLITVYPDEQCHIVNLDMPLEKKSAIAHIKNMLQYVFKKEDVILFERSRQSKKHSLVERLSDKHKGACRLEAKKLWNLDRSITIEDMTLRDEINRCFDGRTYSPKTIRNWIKELCPNRKPGRRKIRKPQ